MTFRDACLFANREDLLFARELAKETGIAYPVALVAVVLDKLEISPIFGPCM